MLIFECHMIIT